MNRLIRLKLLFFSFLILLLVVSCKKNESGHKENGTQNSAVYIAAAANLRDILTELKQLYTAGNPGKKVEITFGSSGLLFQQIMNGAPFDLFLSADSLFTEKLKNENKNYGNSEIYAYGRIVIWSSKFDVSKGLPILSNPEIKKIAIANPELAPYGKNTVQGLKRSGLYLKIKDKIVWAESINQAAQFASTGNADLAFVALSNAMNQEMKARGNFYQLSEKESGPIPQSGIILKGKKQTEAQHFFDFIRSKKAVKLWRKYGYQTEIK